MARDASRTCPAGPGRSSRASSRLSLSLRTHTHTHTQRIPPAPWLFFFCAHADDLEHKYRPRSLHKIQPVDAKGNAIVDKRKHNDVTSDGHQAILLLVHPERHGHLYVVASTRAARRATQRAKSDAEWRPTSKNDLSIAAYSVLESGQPLLSFKEEDDVSIAPLCEKGGTRFIGCLISGPPPVPDEWLVKMAEVAGPMLDMVWRRQQLSTIIKVAQAWVQDYANEPDPKLTPHHMTGTKIRKQYKKKKRKGSAATKKRSNSVASTASSASSDADKSSSDSGLSTDSSSSSDDEGGGKGGKKPLAKRKSSSSKKDEKAAKAEGKKSLPPVKGPAPDRNQGARTDSGRKQSKAGSSKAAKGSKKPLSESEAAAEAAEAAAAEAAAAAAAAAAAESAKKARQARQVAETQERLYATRMTAMWFEVSLDPESAYRNERRMHTSASKSKQWEGADLHAFGGLTSKNSFVVDQAHMAYVHVLVKHGNGLPAGILKVLPLQKSTVDGEVRELSTHVVSMLHQHTAPALQSAINDIGNMHMGDRPPPSPIFAVGGSMEAHAALVLPKKLQHQMRLELAKMDVRHIVSEFHSYAEPPATVLSVVRAVLCLTGHSKSTGIDTSTWELCKPLCTFALFKDMQTLNLVYVDKKLHTEDRWREAAAITRGMDIESSMRKFPHGVKIMLQWLEAAKLVHRMAVQVHNDEEKRKQTAKDNAAVAIQSIMKGQGVRSGMRRLLGEARGSISISAAEQAERRAKAAAWREQMLDPWATKKGLAHPDAAPAAAEDDKK